MILAPGRWVGWDLSFRIGPYPLGGEVAPPTDGPDGLPVAPTGRDQLQRQQVDGIAQVTRHGGQRSKRAAEAGFNPGAGGGGGGHGRSPESGLAPLPPPMRITLSRIAGRCKRNLCRLALDHDMFQGRICY